METTDPPLHAAPVQGWDELSKPRAPAAGLLDVSARIAAPLHPKSHEGWSALPEGAAGPEGTPRRLPVLTSDGSGRRRPGRGHGACSSDLVPSRSPSACDNKKLVRKFRGAFSRSTLSSCSCCTIVNMLSTWTIGMTCEFLVSKPPCLQAGLRQRHYMHAANRGCQGAHAMPRRCGLQRHYMKVLDSIAVPWVKTFSIHPPCLWLSFDNAILVSLPLRLSVVGYE